MNLYSQQGYFCWVLKKNMTPFLTTKSESSGWFCSQPSTPSKSKLGEKVSQTHPNFTSGDLTLRISGKSHGDFPPHLLLGKKNKKNMDKWWDIGKCVLKISPPFFEHHKHKKRMKTSFLSPIAENDDVKQLWCCIVPVAKGTLSQNCVFWCYSSWN